MIFDLHVWIMLWDSYVQYSDVLYDLCVWFVWILMHVVYIQYSTVLSCLYLVERCCSNTLYSDVCTVFPVFNIYSESLMYFLTCIYSDVLFDLYFILMNRLTCIYSDVLSDLYGFWCVLWARRSWRSAYRTRSPDMHRGARAPGSCSAFTQTIR